jgi:hypothetical protein
MRINEERQIVEHDSKLGEDSLRHCKSAILIPFDDDIDIPLTPNDKTEDPKNEKCP